VILALIVGAVVFSSASNNTDESKFRATESLQWKGNHRVISTGPAKECVEFLVTAARREQMSYDFAVLLLTDSSGISLV
jgi:hypothetical protein